MTEYQVALVMVILQEPGHVFEQTEQEVLKRMMHLGWVLPQGGGMFVVTKAGEDAYKERLGRKTEEEPKMMRIRFSENVVATLCKGVRTIVKYYNGQEFWATAMDCTDRTLQVYTIYLTEGEGRIVGVPARAFNIVEVRRAMV